MLKKLLTGCLTIAMIGAFSASVSAETTFTWSGDVTGTYLMQSNKDGTEDAETLSKSVMKATGDLDLAVVKSGDNWTGTAYFDFDFKNNTDLEVDDLYVKMANEQFAISVGAFDPIGIGQGGAYLGEIDDTYGAGELFIPGEQGWLQVSLVEIGLDIFAGMNKPKYEYDDPGTSVVTLATENLFDATTDGEYASTAFGFTFKKTINIIDLGIQYVTMSTSVDENNSSDSTKDGNFDGLSANEMSLAVTANFNEQMALTLNFSSGKLTPGTSGAKEQSIQTTELSFDYGFSDTMGLTAVYGQYVYNTGESGKGNEYTGTEMNLTLNIKTDGIDHYIAYQAMDLQSDASGSKAATETKMAYSMRVAF
jgi:hypothetical protein